MTVDLAEAVRWVLAEPGPVMQNRHYRTGGWVYLLASEEFGFVKIGWAKNVQSRISEIICMSPIPLTLVGQISGTRDLEKYFHGNFEDDRVHHEWFRISPRMKWFIETYGDGTDKWCERQREFDRCRVPRRENGRGTIYQRKDGKWVAQLTVEGRRKCFTGRNRPEVALKMKTYLNRLEEPDE